MERTQGSGESKTLSDNKNPHPTGPGDKLGKSGGEVGCWVRPSRALPLQRGTGPGKWSDVAQLTQLRRERLI